MKTLKVEKLTTEAFEKYGVVLGNSDMNYTADTPSLKVQIGISDLLELQSESTVWGYLTLNKHENPVKEIERHVKSAEAFIPLEGQSVVIVAEKSDPTDANAVPDENTLRAFLLDGSAGVFFPKGSWHWAPYPITDSATFLLLLDKGIMNDIEVKEIQARVLILY